MDVEEKVRNAIEKGELIDNAPVIYLISKRLFDITSSLLGLLFLSPLLILVAAVIKIESRGPVLFVQERRGLKGKAFKMYKFRSMVFNAEQLFKELEQKNEVSGPMFKIKSDPRVTRIGRIIRKSSIDELPQLFNVLRGNMSLVGPRPPLSREVEKYAPLHCLRLSVKPGITGLWQITARNTVEFNEVINLDLKYIRERNFWYDIKIILKTIPVLLGDKNAF